MTGPAKYHAGEFQKAWDNWKRGLGKTRTLAGVYQIAMLADESGLEPPGTTKEFFDLWRSRHERPI